jgi:hypothetical protein
MIILFLKKIKSEFSISKKVNISLFSFSIVSLFFMLVKYYNEAYHYHGIIIKQTTFKKTYFDKNSMILSEGIEVEYNGIGKVGIDVILPNGQEGIISANDFKQL